mgnify:CR=1 FL=1
MHQAFLDVVLLNGFFKIAEWVDAIGTLERTPEILNGWRILVLGNKAAYLKVRALRVRAPVRVEDGVVAPNDQDFGACCCRFDHQKNETVVSQNARNCESIGPPSSVVRSVPREVAKNAIMNIISEDNERKNRQQEGSEERKHNEQRFGYTRIEK